MSLQLRSPLRNQINIPISPIKHSPYTFRKPKARSNALFSRTAVPHAKCSPNRKNHDETHSISPRVDINDNLDTEKQETVISNAHICHDYDVETEDMTFFWEDQDSFLNDLQEKSLEGRDDSHRLDLAVESIQSTFTAKAESLNVEFAQLMVPVSNRIRSSFQHIEVNADSPMIKGLDVYEHAVQSLVRVSRDEKRQVDNKYLATKASSVEKISVLLQELEQEYQTRNKLWSHYEQALDEQVNAMKDLLHDAPGRMEKIIAKLEKKQSKELESNQPDALNMNRLLAQLLGNH